MELSIDLLANVALDVMGYLAAGALAVVLYQLLQKNKKRVITAPVEKTDAGEKSRNGVSDMKAEGKNLQFVNFQENKHNNSSDYGKYRGGNPRRSRDDVIRLARQMIASGTPDARIRELLPITEAELALLNYGEK